MENIRTEIRAVEKHVKEQTPSPAEQIAIISKAQGMITGDEHCLVVLAIAKNRIIREMEK